MTTSDSALVLRPLTLLPGTGPDAPPDGSGNPHGSNGSGSSSSSDGPGGSDNPPESGAEPGSPTPGPYTAETLRGRARALAAMPRLQVLRTLETSARGLLEAEADTRLCFYGDNTSPLPAPTRRLRRVAGAAASPFVALLFGLAVLAALLGNVAGATVVFLAAALSCTLRLAQERRGEQSVAGLRAMVCATATVVRRATSTAAPTAREVPVSALVPGDVVVLAPGDLVPADVYLLAAEDLEVSEWVLTGESRPAVKSAAPASGLGRSSDADGPGNPGSPGSPGSPSRFDAHGREPDRSWLCLMGGIVARGTGTGVVIATGAHTVFATSHPAAPGRATATAFDRATRRLTWLLLGFAAIAVPVVLALDAAVHGLRAQSLGFALAVAVGLTPEMLPVVVTTVLTRAARSLARRDGTAVRRLPAVHDLAAMDILCVDKTGTLTEGELVVAGSFDARGEPSTRALSWSVAVSRAVLAHAPGLAGAFEEALADAAPYNEPVARVAHLTRIRPDAQTQPAPPTPGPLNPRSRPDLFDALDVLDVLNALDIVDVLPFCPRRRRVTALIRNPRRPGTLVLATHGAVEEILDACATRCTASGTAPLTTADRAAAARFTRDQAADGLRLLAVAVAELPPRRRHRTSPLSLPPSLPLPLPPLAPDEEPPLSLVGFVTLRDEAKAGAPEALAQLAALGVAVKVLTGDAREPAAQVCRRIGVEPGHVVTGAQIDACDDGALAALAADTAVFARVDPDHKARIVAALRAGGAVVGFLGDGVNDIAALRAADVGIAVRDGADLARECADIVLDGRDLAGLARAVERSRRAVVNGVAYLRITVSSNVGNALSMALAPLLIPFLPMLPLQVLVQNLGFDVSQLALAGDRVDPASTGRARRFTARDAACFALLFGPLNTLADAATFLALHAHQNPVDGHAAQAVFQAGWFAENLITQAIALVALRAGRRARAGRPSWPVTVSALALAAGGLLLPVTGLGAAMGFAAPPDSFYPLLALIACGYWAALLGVKALLPRIRRTGW